MLQYFKDSHDSLFKSVALLSIHVLPPLNVSNMWNLSRLIPNPTDDSQKTLGRLLWLIRILIRLFKGVVQWDTLQGHDLRLFDKLPDKVGAKHQWNIPNYKISNYLESARIADLQV